MNIKLVRLLSAICACLVALIFIEWVVAKYARNRLLDSIESSNTTGSSVLEMPSIKLKEKAEESYVDLVSRPLFIKGRKPVDEPTAENEKKAVSAENLDWQLNGVYTGKNGLSALFSRVKTKSDKDNYRKLTLNDDLDGWKLTEIHKDKVLLTRGDEPIELLLRKPKPKEQSKNPNASKPPVPNTQITGRRRPGQEGMPISSPQTD
ncbi:MAG TPA: hypothetical protein VLS45_06860, partial [Methylomicrobium sp.]|nr:hypothetical protein [Methylomicrobium sp.]